MSVVEGGIYVGVCSTAVEGGIEGVVCTSAGVKLVSLGLVTVLALGLVTVLALLFACKSK